MLVDPLGRRVTGLRISLTQECNLSCFYCHLEGCAPGPRQMDTQELAEILQLAKELGISEIKLTGGEPLLRKDLPEVLERNPGLDLSMTTNATLLAPLVQKLARAGLRRVNIDLPTLDPRKYERITGGPLLPQVLEGIVAAVEAGLTPVKLNMVVLKGVNEEEVEPMIRFCSERGLVLQLIELLPIRPDLQSFWLDLSPLEKKLEGRALKVERREMHFRRKFLLPECEVEVVRSMHNTEFCLHCTRLRLTPDGYLKPCLMRNDNLVDLLTPIRKGNLEVARRAFLRATQLKEPFFKAPQTSVGFQCSGAGPAGG